MEENMEENTVIFVAAHNRDAFIRWVKSHVRMVDDPRSVEGAQNFIVIELNKWWEYGRSAVDAMKVLQCRSKCTHKYNR